MFVVVRRLDDRSAGAPEDRRRVSVEFHLVDEDVHSGHDEALQPRAFTDGAFGKELESELEAVGDDALLLADAHRNAGYGAAAGHVDRDRHDALREPELVHQGALVVGTSRERSCSTIATASGTALATGSRSPMQPSSSGPGGRGSHPTAGAWA